MITTVSLVNTSYKIFSCDGKYKNYSFRNFQIYNIVLLTMVILYIISPEWIYLIIGICIIRPPSLLEFLNFNNLHTIWNISALSLHQVLNSSIAWFLSWRI